MAVLAIVMCASFASCKNDDENNTSGNNKKLVRIDLNNEPNWEFTYDSQGLLILSYGGSCGQITYGWGNNTISTSHLSQPMYLENNLISSMIGVNNDNYILTYNSSGELIKEIVNNTYYNTSSTKILDFTWQNSKLTKVHQKYINDAGEYGITETEEISEYIYSGKTCKGYFPYLPYSFFGDNFDIFWAHPELIGLCNSQLPDEKYSKDEDFESTSKYTYTFDKDGYVESCTVVTTSKRLFDDTNYTTIQVFAFTWE